MPVSETMLGKFTLFMAALDFTATFHRQLALSSDILGVCLC